ncbi:YqeG family HAD IIIA-type phosphatase [Candidatus Margulisiibacteriota bacterium]
MSVFKPKEYRDSIHDIDLQDLKNKGISHLIVDLDETLRKRNDDHIPASSIEWINKAKEAGFNLCVSSNSFFPWKFKKIREKLNVPCYAFTIKPLPFAFWKALKILSSKTSNTAMIGDQLFTDIVGANLLGIYTIMVAAVTKDEKGFHRRLMRWVERKFYKPS